MLAQVLFHVSRFLKLCVNFRNFELYHVLTYTSLLVLIQPNLQTNSQLKMIVDLNDRNMSCFKLKVVIHFLKKSYLPAIIQTISKKKIFNAQLQKVRDIFSSIFRKNFHYFFTKRLSVRESCKNLFFA